MVHHVIFTTLTQHTANCVFKQALRVKQQKVRALVTLIFTQNTFMHAHMIIHLSGKILSHKLLIPVCENVLLYLQPVAQLAACYSRLNFSLRF